MSRGVESPGRHGLSHARPRVCLAARGFTLIEILITLGLLVLLAGLTWPALQNQITAAELPESADRLRTALFMARCEAMLEHRRFRISFAPEEQHPKIEWEADPVNQRGIFVPATADWAEEAILLGDVQVHEVRPGRPVYMQPLSETSDPDSLLKAAEEQERERIERESRNQGVGIAANQDEEPDPQRPSIIFETDGSTDWATLVLSRVPPGQPLEENEEQTWVVIDGRTGLVTIRERVTKEQLSDAKFYVKRENLEPPDRTDVDDLKFEITQDLTGGSGLTAGNAGTGDTGGAADQGVGELTASLEELGKTTGQPSAEQPKDEAAVNESETEDAKTVEDVVEDSDLTEEEQGKVIRAFPRRRR